MAEIIDYFLARVRRPLVLGIRLPQSMFAFVW